MMRNSMRVDVGVRIVDSIDLMNSYPGTRHSSKLASIRHATKSGSPGEHRVLDMGKHSIDKEAQELIRLFQANRLVEARAVGIRLIREAPNNREVLSILGAIHGRLGEFRDAESCYQTLVSLEPRVFQHHCYLGLSLIMQRRLEEAAKPFQAMLQLRPDFAEGHMHMGCLARDLGHHDMAIQHLREAMRLAPSLIDAAIFLANILIFRGELAEALTQCEAALAKNPSHSEALASKALVLERQGHQDAAWQCVSTIVSSAAPSFGAAIVYAKLAPKYGRAEQAASLLEKMLTRPMWAPSQRQELHFALGTLYDKSAEYDAAFKQFQAANTLNPLPPATEEQRRKTDRIIEIIRSANLRSVKEPLQAAPIPIFIVGMPRSGTSLVEQILASHPDVAAGGELEFLNDLEHRVRDVLGSQEPYPECLREATSEDMAALARPYLDAITEISGGARFVTDKLPGNYERLGLIEKLFPNARIIHTMRHPLDTCLSCYFQNFGNTHPYTSSLHALGEVYLQYRRLMTHWRSILSIWILDMQYEQLVSSPEKEVRRLLEFCELTWHQKCLEFYKSGRYVNTASYDQVRQPIYQTSAGRWKHYEPYLRELKDTLSGLQMIG